MRFLKSAWNWFGDFLHSIRFRITLWFVFILAIVLTIFSGFIYFNQARDLQGDSVGNIQAKFARLLGYFRSAAWQNSSLGLSDVPDNTPPLQQGDMLALVDANGQIIQSWGVTPSSKLVGDLVSAASGQQGLNVYEQTISATDPNGTAASADYLFIVSPVLRGRMPIGALIIGTPTSLTSELQRLRVSLILGSLFMLLIAFTGGLWLADRAMRPVKTIAHAARNISESDLSRRINLRGRDELAELASTFDNMLSRLQIAFDRQRRFVADASHELRTPLTITNLEINQALARDRSSADYQRALQTIHVENERMTRMVNDLMTLARMDSGQAILQFEKMDLSDAALEAVERLTALAEQQQITLETTELPELIVKGDRQYLIQMISNLIENAIKYSGSGQTVRVETGPGPADRRQFALLRITDTGPGIPPEHLPHLFDRFYRVDQARTQEDDPSAPTGSGLGLSIVAWIVEAHGGKIRVESRVNFGTTFEVTLPLALDN
ncbi:MAG TPA: ATP-binding protein [Anaerolineales bacterium]|nr:ATP-binding protein [Anaerolineales bacterium]